MNQTMRWRTDGVLAAAALALAAVVGGCSSQEGAAPTARDAAAPSPPAATAPSPVETAQPGLGPGPAESIEPEASATPGPAQPEPSEQPAGGAASQPEAISVREAAGGQAPIAADGPSAGARRTLFRDWPKPRLALFLTGQQNGYIEPCGCSGLTNQKGGMIRRRSCQRELAEKMGWPLIAIDAGNQVRRYGRQAEVKLQMTVEGLKKMNYQAIGLGPDDLRLSIGELVAVTAGDGQGRGPFLASNVVLLDPSLIPPYLVREAGGKRVGIAAVLGDSRRNRVTSDEIVIRGAADSLAEVWPRLEQEGCDLYVLVACAELQESKELARRFDGFDMVVTTGGAAEPAFEPEIAPGGAMLVQVGEKGMYVVVVGVFDDDQNRLRYQRVPLDDRWPDSREMLDLLASYQGELERAGLQGLGLRPIAHPSGRTFTGSKVCGDCHTKAYEAWEKTSHAHAMDSLTHPGERSEVPRYFDPECISCHVVGWNPQKFFPYTSGYLSLQETPDLTGVGCENCHGPGSQHAAVEMGDADASDQEREALRESMQLPLDESRGTCLECHDLDNSFAFQDPGAFLQYWKKVKHRGVD